MGLWEGEVVLFHKNKNSIILKASVFTTREFLACKKFKKKF